MKLPAYLIQLMMERPYLKPDVADTANALTPLPDFPFTEDVSYLNSAGIGLVPVPVSRAVEELERDVATRGTVAYFEHVARIKQEPRDAGARLLNARPQDIAIVNSVSEVISQFAAWLRPAPPQNVVTIDIDHPAVTYPWLRVAEQTGVEVRFVRAESDPSNISVQKLAVLVDDRTAVICVSMVNWRTGHRLDLNQLANLAHSHGAILVVDAIHGAGVVPIDVVESGVDLLVTGAFKWLCSFAGAGICYIHPALADRMKPVLLGFGSAAGAQAWADADATRLDLPSGARKLEYGSSSRSARFGLAQSVDYLMKIGIEAIFAHNTALADRLGAGLDQLGAVVITPRNDAARGGILTASFPGKDAIQLYERLNERGVFTLPRLGALRFAPHLFNRNQDIDLALTELEDLLKA